MFKYYLIFFGLNCERKIISKFSTGLTLAALFLVVHQFTMGMKFSYDIKSIAIRIFCLSAQYNNLFSYIFIKYKSKEMFEFFYQTESFKKEKNIKKKPNYSSIIALIVTSLMVSSPACLTASHPHLDNIIKQFMVRKSNSPIPSIPSFLLILIYSISWKIMIQLIYYKIIHQYNSLIAHFNEETVRKQNNPDLSDILEAQKYILTLIHFQSFLIKNKKILSYFLFFDIISMNLKIIFALITIPYLDVNFYFFGLLFMVVYTSHFLWIKIASYIFINREKELIFQLTQWQKLDFIENYCIELKVLERTVQLFDIHGNVELFVKEKSRYDQVKISNKEKV